MGTFQGQFQDAINALKVGRLTLEQVLTLAKQSPGMAAHLACGELVEMPINPAARTTPLSPAVVELAWKLAGSTSCLSFRFSGVEPKAVVEQFLRERLSRFPDEFTDQDLALAAHWWPNLAEHVNRIKASPFGRRRCEASGSSDATFCRRGAGQAPGIGI